MFDKDLSCNSIIFDESNNVCTRAFYSPGPPFDQRGTGLRVAWASTIYSHGYNEKRAIDADHVNDVFHTNAKPGERIPWLAIDLVGPEKVTKVKMTNRNHGHKVLKSELVMTNLLKSAQMAGPAIPDIASSVPCSAPLIGRYVTQQKIMELQPTLTDLNLVEVILDSSPMLGPENDRNSAS